jgi:hypothetical protein
MAHVRTQIRAWLKTNLAGSADAGARVYISRALPLPKDLRPTLLVSIQSESSNDMSMGDDPMQERVPVVRVTACAKGDSEETEDVLDRMAVFVEGVFAGDPTMGGLIQTYSYQTTEFNFGGDNEATLCTAALTFALQVYTRRGDPETAL